MNSVNQVVLTSLVVFHEPTRTYFDPLTGKIFYDDDQLQSQGSKPPQLTGLRDHAEGAVIMPKLGNETAKYVFNGLMLDRRAKMSFRALLGQATWKLM